MCHEIQLTKNKMDLNKSKMKNIKAWIEFEPNFPGVATPQSSEWIIYIISYAYNPFTAPWGLYPMISHLLWHPEGQMLAEFWSPQAMGVEITITIIEISLKLNQHKKYGWNNTNSHRFVFQNQQLNFLPILASQKIIALSVVILEVTLSQPLWHHWVTHQ